MIANPVICHVGQAKDKETVPQHSESRLLPYSARSMYDLVADIEAYPEFIPWCVAIEIRSRERLPVGEIVEADMFVSFKIYRERMRSRVHLKPEELIISIAYSDGPLKHMDSEWRFRPMGEGRSVIEFDLSYEFKSRLLQGVVGVFFGEAMQIIVAAFEKRAKALYGNQ